MAPRVWGFVALAGVAAGVTFLVATTPAVREGVWLATLVVSFLAALVAGARSPQGRRYPWYLVSACQGVFVFANLLANPLWATQSTTAWATPLAVAGFPLLTVAALAFRHAQGHGGDRESAIDGGIVMVAMAAVLAATAYHPELLSQDLPASSRVLYAVVAPLLMSAVVAAWIGLLFTSAVRLASAWFFAAAAVAGLVGNTFRSVLIANDTYERGTPTDLLILATHVLVAMACLHPSAVMLTQPADPRRRQFTAARLTVLGAALVAIPITLLVRGVDASLVPSLVGAVLVSLLVLWRISRLAVERQEAQEQLRRAAVHDALTGLPNRRLILDRLAQTLARQARDGSPVGVMFVDLDGFKRVNDDRGHQVGDELLIMVARRLEEVVRRSDTVGRLGGDEFVLICDVADGGAAMALAERVANRLSQPYEIQGRPARISASVGLTLPTGGRSDPEQVLLEADAAMYSAKAQVGAAVVIYDRSLAEHGATRRTLERDLEQAVQRDELWLAFQPLWRFWGPDGGREMIGAEALVRWNHPTRGLLLSEDFLPIAEDSDLILAVGEVVLTRACEQLAVWQEVLHSEPGWTLYVNLAERQLVTPGLVDRVAELLATHQLRPDRLGFDISERAVVDDRVIATANALHRLGTRLAWDDVGTGFSSLAHLRGWPLDVLKLDGSLVRSAGEQVADAGMIRAVCSVADELGIEVLAKHVDSPQVLFTAQDLGCDLGQGHHLGPPVPGDQLRLPCAADVVVRQGDGPG
ncbi:MAG TPA: EAL domain-containing protein [Ilumatobacteraceae bacterium]|nr:EAL domain-containing protein [Ilumatobacteraceae bacterium]